VRQLSTYAPDELRSLLRLQLLDTEIGAQQAALRLAESGSELAQARSDAASAREAERSLDARLGGVRRDLRYEEQEVAALRAEIAAQERKLYGGGVRNPKEAAQLEQHVASLRRRMGDLEDKALSLMLELESLEPEMTEAKARAADADAALSDAESLLAARIQGLSAKLPELEVQRAQLAAAVLPDLLRQYEALRTRRGGIAVVALADGKCSGCRMAVPFMTVRDVRQGALRTCDSCGRIIVEA